MRLVLLAVGRMKAGPERELLQRYLGRAQAGARAVGLSAVDQIEVEESRARRKQQRTAEEAEALQARMPAGSRILCLDERGTSMSSADLSRGVATSRDRGDTAFSFIIGGPDGLAPEFMERHASLAFGAVTFPHQLVRVLVAEQMYRITTILAGHPYHRA